jgi:multicomponent Na+:H+ antiporter subunit F
MSVLAILVFGLLMTAMLLAVLRLVRGPSLPMRVVALDLMSSLSVGFIAAFSFVTDQPLFLDVALVLSLVSFLGTVALAYYIEKGGLPWGRS